MVRQLNCCCFMATTLAISIKEERNIFEINLIIITLTGVYCSLQTMITWKVFCQKDHHCQCHMGVVPMMIHNNEMSPRLTHWDVVFSYLSLFCHFICLCRWKEYNWLWWPKKCFYKNLCNKSLFAGKHSAGTCCWRWSSSTTMLLSTIKM